MEPQESTAIGGSDLPRLLHQLRLVGQDPDRALLDSVKSFGQASVRSLIEIAIDDRLLNTDYDSPEAWAPLHAIQLLGELGASEAVEPLLPLFDSIDDSWLAETLPVAYGGFGAPALAPLRSLLFDRTKLVWARVRAAESLGNVGQRHPETRSDVVNLLVARLDPAESQTHEDESLNGFVISALLDLKAVEAAPAIRRAFDEHLVDTLVVSLDDAAEKLGLAPKSRSRQSAGKKGLPLRVRCTACGYEDGHDVETVYCDLGTMERREKGKKTPFSEFVVPQRLTCPKCGVVDQYELAAMAYMALMAETLKKMAASKTGGPDAEPTEGSLRFIRFGLADGREMHPIAALDMYRKKVEADPNSADLRVRYGNVLRFMGYGEEASEQYRAALRLESSNLEAYLNLARFASDAGNRKEARRMYEGLLAQAPSSGLSREDRETYVEAASEELIAVGGSPERFVAAPPAKQLIQREDPANRGLGAGTSKQPVRVAQKVGRNEPCPCGSGKKYKKCHGR
ncbi:MAG: DUF1186 domain-containing protein [Dehalococcoidia bacterium]|nr:DUF1186 domain-containing protein [Dehalococcoidia bacterium]